MLSAAQACLFTENAFPSVAFPAEKGIIIEKETEIIYAVFHRRPALGDKDTITKNYTKDNRVFADIVNLALFHGEHVVKPGDVEELDTAELHVLFSVDAGGRKPEAVQKYRDVLKKVTLRGEVFIARIIAGVENQSASHYAMPVRNMLYDALNYANQVVETAKSHREHGEKLEPKEFLSGMKKQDRLIPVKTIVVSYDAGEWDGPLTLHGLLDWEGIPEEVREEIPDYAITLLQPSDMDDGVLGRLPSSFGQTMGFIKYSGDAGKLEKFVAENEEGFRHFPMEAVAVLDAFCNLGSMEIEEYEEGGECNMCKALTDIMDREMEKGKAEGIAEGIAQGIAEGITRGMAKGKAQGMAEGKITALANLVVNGMLSLEDALSVAGLSREDFIQEAATLNIIIKL